MTGLTWKYVFFALAATLVHAPVAPPAVAEGQRPPSIVSLPVSLDLAVLQAKLNAEVPTQFADIDQAGLVCIPEKRISTKVPKFKGLKLYFETVETIISPDIRCDVRGWVRRTGDIGLLKAGNALRVLVPVAAEATVRGRGDIGKHIRETGNAAAMFFFDIQPGISSDWQPHIRITSQFEWTMRPEIQLFGIIRVTFGSDVEPKLREALVTFQARIAELIHELALRKRIENIWQDIQKPIPVDGDTNLALHLNPRSAGYSGISIDENALRTTIVFRALPEISAERTSDRLPVLPDLQMTAPGNGSFEVTLPVTVALTDVETSLQQALPTRFTFSHAEYNVEGDMTVSKVAIEPADNDRIAVTLDYAANLCGSVVASFFSGPGKASDCYENSGVISLTARLSYDGATKKLTALSPRIATRSTSRLVDLMIRLGKLPLLSSLIENRLTVDLSQILDDLTMKANDALNRDLGDGLRLHGQVSAADFASITVAGEAARIVATARGTAGLVWSRMARRRSANRDGVTRKHDDNGLPEKDFRPPDPRHARCRGLWRFRTGNGDMVRLYPERSFQGHTG